MMFMCRYVEAPRINFANTSHPYGVAHTVMIKAHTAVASDLESTSDKESTPDSDIEF